MSAEAPDHVTKEEVLAATDALLGRPDVNPDSIASVTEKALEIAGTYVDDTDRKPLFQNLADGEVGRIAAVIALKAAVRAAEQTPRDNRTDDQKRLLSEHIRFMVPRHRARNLGRRAVRSPFIPVLH